MIAGPYRRDRRRNLPSRAGAATVDVYLDGVLSTNNDLEKQNVNQFAAVEYYAGGATIPVQYNRTGSSCGVLLLWSRER